MVDQIIHTTGVRDSKIIQVGGDYHVSVSQNVLPHDEKPVYFTYGDSDVQFLLFGVGTTIPHQTYYDALEEAFRLLIAFKPISVQLVIAASSIIQSDLTSALFRAFQPLWETDFPHVVILRRESNWEDYIDKRIDNSKNLTHIPRYQKYYSGIACSLDDYPTLTTDVVAGRSCADSWAIEASNILSSMLDPKQRLSRTNLIEFSDEILNDSVFVWEEINDRLLKRGIILPRWSKDLQLSLVKSYLMLRADRFCFPSGISLRYDFSFHSPCVLWYVNLRLLRHLVKLCGVYDELMGLTPASLSRLTINPYFLEYKSKVSNAQGTDNLVLLAYKHRDTFSRALTLATRPQ